MPSVDTSFRANPPAPECGDSDQGACVYVCESPEFQNLGPQKLGALEASDFMIDGPLEASDFTIDGPIIHCPLSTTHYPLPIIHYLLSTTHYPLPMIHYQLYTTHYPLLIIHYTLSQLSLLSL